MAGASSFVHPLCDGTAGHRAWAETLADRVYYSEGLAGFFGWVLGRGLRPVLVTHPDGRLTFPALYHLRACGGLWLCRLDEGGYRDLRSGVVYPGIGDVPDVAEDAGLPAPGVEACHVWWSFSVSVQQPAEVSTVLGEAVEVLWRGLMGVLPVAWGWHEPCLVGWDKGAYTVSARELMPYASMVVSGAGRCEAQAVGTARRNELGVEESLAGVGVAGPAGADLAGLAVRAVEALGAVAEACSMPLVGLVSVVGGGPEVRFGVPFTPIPVPLALLVGPRVLRDVGVEAASFAGAHGGRLVGRGRFPSVVVPLLGVDGDVWGRLLGVVGEFTTGPVLGGVAGQSSGVGWGGAGYAA